jgi:DNA-binding transcriptional LysR family regulator
MSVNLGELDLNLLRVFDALMQEQNLSRAAQRLHLSQPATSNALARLRSQLDEPLFVRTARGMQPTARALAMHGPVRQALRLLTEGLAEKSAFVPDEAENVFTVAMNDYAQATVLPPLVARFRAIAPGVVLSVQPDTAESLVTRLSAGTLDLALDYIHFDGADLLYEPLVEEELCVVARARHPALDGGLTAASFEAARHVSVQPRAGRGSPLEIVLGAAKVRRQVALFVPYYLTIPAIVADSDLLGVVPLRMALRFRGVLPIDTAPLPFSMPKTQISLIWHRQQALAPGLAWLRSEIHALIRGLEARLP